MPEEVELRLVANNSDAVRKVKELATESSKLYTNNEKAQKREKGLIEDIEQEISKMTKLKKEAWKIEDIEKYNKKIEEAKLNLNEYDKAGLKAEKTTQTLTQQMTKWVLGLGGAAAITKVLLGAVKELTVGVNAYNIVTAVSKQVLADVISLQGINFANIQATIIAQSKLNELRLRDNVELVKTARLRRTYQEQYAVYLDQTKTEPERLAAIDKALKAHNEAIDIEIENTKERFKIVNEEMDRRPGNEKLMREYAELLAELENLEASRVGETKRLLTARSTLIQNEIERQEKWQNDLHTKLQDWADGIIEERLENEKRFQEMSLKLLEDYEKAQIESLEGDAKLKAQRDFGIKQLAEYKKQLTDLGKLSAEQESMFYFLGSQIEKAYLDGLAKEHPDKIKAAAGILTQQFGKVIDATKLKTVPQGSGESDADPFWLIFGIDSSTPLGSEAIEQLKNAASTTMDIMDEIYQARVDDAQRNRELLDTRISETQSALETEVELAKEGYANNVIAKQKELEELKIQREKALKDEEKAIKAQRALDTVSQVSSLVTSSANIFETLSKLGPIGVGIAIATIATMIGAFAAAKVNANKVTKLARGGHGEVSGRLHSEGGESFLSHVEVEQGERWGVLSRSASRKYGPVFGKMVDSFNRDSLFIPKGGTINNMIVENTGPNRRLDEVNSNLRRIHAKEEIKQIGNRIIITKGNTTRIIKK